jgi:hypothetical protein
MRLLIEISIFGVLSKLIVGIGNRIDMESRSILFESVRTDGIEASDRFAEVVEGETLF